MTEFGKYLLQCPYALRSKTSAMGLLKDALQNDMPKFRVLQAAYELGILDALRKSNPLSPEDKMRVLTGLRSQYAMTESAAQNAILYWESSITSDILRRADEFDASAPVDEVTTTGPTPASKAQGTAIPANRPTIIEISQDAIRFGLRIQWKRQPGIQGYEVWRAEENQVPVLIKSGSFAIPRYQDFEVQEGKLYTYAIRGILDSEKGLYTPESNNMQLVAPCRTLSFQFRDIKFDSNCITLFWNLIFDCRYYIVEKFDTFEDRWYPIATLTAENTHFSDSTAAAGKSNRYRVTCEGQSGIAQTSSEIKVYM